MPKVNCENIQQSLANTPFAESCLWYILDAKSKQILYIAMYRGCILDKSGQLMVKQYA